MVLCDLSSHQTEMVKFKSLHKGSFNHVTPINTGAAWQHTYAKNDPLPCTVPCTKVLYITDILSSLGRDALVQYVTFKGVNPTSIFAKQSDCSSEAAGTYTHCLVKTLSLTG